MTMLPWRGVDRMGDHFSDLAEVVAATGESGAFTYDPTTGGGAYVEVEPIGESSTWGATSGATAYVDRGRVWLDGLESTSGGSTAVGTLPAGKRPASTVYLPMTFANDIGGTPALCAGFLSITPEGVVTLNSTETPTGSISIFLAGLSFKVAP